ncbi:MAG TPA: peptide ABC transporter substrate-binding protein [Patescibacteria group bacterium]|nr:peptide ABC transporter substrate-binding protein [Patescibacteria group bacterium]
MVVTCGGVGAAPRDELSIGIAQRLPTLHPLRTSAAIVGFLWGFVNRSVTGFDDAWSSTCFLCTEVPTRENGRIKVIALADGHPGMEVTYSIRPEMVWADGVPVSAHDAVFTAVVARAVGVGSYASTYYAHVLGIAMVDEHTFTVTFDEVNYSFAAPVDFELLSEHIEGPIYRASHGAADYLAHSAYATHPTDPGLWSGPYRITAFDKDSIVLDRNAYWAGAKTQFKRITLKPIPDGVSPAAWLLGGSIDYVAGEVAGLSMEQAVDLAGQYPDRFDLISRPTLSFEHLGINHDNPLLADRRVRQALLQSIDRAEMARQLFHDAAPIADSPVSPRDPGYDPNVRHYTFNPVHARQLLAEAGFHPGADGVLVDPANHRFSVELLIPSGNPERVRMGDWIKQGWAAVGVETRVTVIGAAEFFGRSMPQGKFDVSLFAWILVPEIPPTTSLSTQAIPTAQNGFSGLNYEHFSNHDLDETVKLLVAELEPSRRLPQWRKFQRLYTEELPTLPLFWHDGTFLIPKWLGGVNPTGHRTATSYWAERWRSE